MLTSLTRGVLAGLLMSASALPALADDDARYSAVTPLPRYAQECGSCHMAYPPSLLPPVSWQHILQGLDKHYGVDASLEAADIRAIGQWLKVNADPRQSPPPEDRITRSGWFRHEHGGIGAATWKRKPASQCQACHAGAGRGYFEDD